MLKKPHPEPLVAFSSAHNIGDSSGHVASDEALARELDRRYREESEGRKREKTETREGGFAGPRLPLTASPFTSKATHQVSRLSEWSPSATNNDEAIARLLQQQLDERTASDELVARMLQQELDERGNSNVGRVAGFTPPRRLPHESDAQYGLRCDEALARYVQQQP
jgi:hypothetical protein